MIVITKYNITTGEIIGSFYTSDANNIAENISEGEAYIEGEFLNTQFKVINGVAVHRSDAEINDYEIKRALRGLRRLRNKELSETDWTQSPDSPLTDAKKAEWATYRQALRDLPSNTDDPRNPTWPSKPS